MNEPYHIQRGKIVNPLATEERRVSEAVELSYMGSSEFEFGALPRSLRAFQAGFERMKVRLVNEITQGDKPLRVASMLSDQEFEVYRGHLLRLRGEGERIRTKEYTGFAKDMQDDERCDFWWDIDHHIMWSFNKNFMNRVHHYLQASFRFMDGAKAEGARK